MNIYFIRHGQTDLNIVQALQGQIDTPLNKKGIQQAQLAHASLEQLDLHFDHIFVSPLQRAIQTAEIVCPHHPLIMEPRIIEINYGPYEAYTFSDLNQEMLDFLYRKDPDYAPDGVETLNQVYNRTHAFMEMLRKGSFENVLCVTHGVAMRSLFRDFDMSIDEVWTMDIENCVLYESKNFRKPKKKMR